MEVALVLVVERVELALDQLGTGVSLDPLELAGEVGCLAVAHLVSAERAALGEGGLVGLPALQAAVAEAEAVDLVGCEARLVVERGSAEVGRSPLERVIDRERGNGAAPALDDLLVAHFLHPRRAL